MFLDLLRCGAVGTCAGVPSTGSIRQSRGIRDSSDRFVRGSLQHLHLRPADQSGLTGSLRLHRLASVWA